MIGLRRKALLLGLIAALVAGSAAMHLGIRAYRAQAGWPDPTNPRVSLADVETTVSRRLPVPELTDADFAVRLARSRQDDVVVFDVREADEFEISHVAGARRIDPDMSVDEFQRRFGAELKGRTVVFYCAVGVRSGHMLSRVQAVLTASGASDAYNLRGGIFRWRASGRPLMTAPQSRPIGTEPARDAAVHPYDSRWGQLLERTLQSSKSPQSKAERP